VAKQVDKKGHEYSTCDVCGKCCKKGTSLCKEHSEEFNQFLKDKHSASYTPTSYPQGKKPYPPGVYPHQKKALMFGTPTGVKPPIIIDLEGYTDSSFAKHVAQKKALEATLKKKRKPKPKKKRKKAKGRKVEL
jgi:hypothetical protein